MHSTFTIRGCAAAYPRSNLAAQLLIPSTYHQPCDAGADTRTKQMQLCEST